MQQWDFFADFAFGPGKHTPYEPSADDFAQSTLLRHLYTGFVRDGVPRGVPGFSNSNGAYSSGLVHKRDVEVRLAWQADFCNELQRVGLWQSFWWAN
jgi:hypothetical protein